MKACVAVIAAALQLLLLVEESSTKSTTAAVTWSYDGTADGPQLWWTRFRQCGQRRQSPVNIDYFRTLHHKFRRLKLANINVLPVNQTITNNGHSVQVILQNSTVPTMYGSGLNGYYRFHQLHFHWGANSTRGSEHTINTVRYPLELHLVHYKSQYGSLAEAVNYEDGLAVISVMFVISQTDNPSLAPLVSHLPAVQTPGSSVTVHNMYAISSLIPRHINRFYRYQGSLTTPTCNQVVTWTIFDSTLSISEAQLNAFRSLKNSHGQPLVDNYRPSQPLHERMVRRSFMV